MPQNTFRSALSFDMDDSDAQNYYPSLTEHKIINQHEDLDDARNENRRYSYATDLKHQRDSNSLPRLSPSFITLNNNTPFIKAS